MKKLVTVLFLIAGFPAAALAAQENVGCGVGTIIFDGQSGVAPQVLAATTNGTSGNQTFGITSGTLGCTSDGVVKSHMKTAMFIENNKDQLARDMSVGSGETLASLAQLLGVDAQDRAAFNRVAKDNVASIFTTESVATEQIMASLRNALAADATLSRYQTAL